MMRNKKQSKIWKLIKFLIIPCFLFAIAFGAYSAWEGVSLNSTNESIAFIKEHINSKGKLVDYQNEIGVYDISDLKLFVTDDRVRIDYGKLTLTWSLTDFVSDKVGDDLEILGIKRYRDEKTGRLRLFWYGEEIERWVS